MARRVAHHPGDAELYQPHAAAGGAGELAGGAAQPPAAAARADHLRDQQAASRRGRRQGPRRSGLAGVDLAHSRGPRQARAHGTSGLRRLPQDQRRVGAAHRPDGANGVPRSRPGHAGAHRQHDQRHQLPPLAVRGQSQSDGAAHRNAWASTCSTIQTELTGARKIRRRCELRAALRRDQARQQGGARQAHP